MADANLTISIKTDPAQPLQLVIKNLKEVEKQAKETESAFDKVGGAVTKIGAAFAGLAILKGTFDFVLNATRQTEDLTKQFIRFTGSAEAAEEQLNALKDIPGPPLDELAAANRTLLDFGSSAEQSIIQLKQLNDIAAGSGSKVGDLAEIFGKVQEQGALSTETLKKFSKQVAGFSSEFAASLGISEKALVELADQGKISSDQVAAAFAAMTSEGGKFFGQAGAQADTLTGSLDELGDQTEDLASEVGRVLLPAITGLTKGFAEAAGSAAGFLSEGRNFRKLSEPNQQIERLKLNIETLRDKLKNLQEGGFDLDTVFQSRPAAIDETIKRINLLKDKLDELDKGNRTEAFAAEMKKRADTALEIETKAAEKAAEERRARQNAELAEDAKVADERLKKFQEIETQIATIRAQQAAVKAQLMVEQGQAENEIAVQLLTEREAALTQAMFDAEIAREEMSQQFGSAEVLRVKKNEEAKTLSVKKGEADRLSAVRKAQDEEFNLFTQTESARVQFDQQTYAQRVQTAQKGLNALSSLQNSKSHEAFEIGKAAALAQAAISIPLTAIEAYKSLAGIPYVGPYLGAAAAAAAIIAGTEQLRKIQATRFAEGGMVMGVGNKDNVPALLTPGEVVVPNKNFDQLRDDMLAGAAAQDQVILTRQTNDILIRIFETLTIGTVNEKLTTMISQLDRVAAGIAGIDLNIIDRSSVSDINAANAEIVRNQPQLGSSPTGGTQRAGSAGSSPRTGEQLERLRNRVGPGGPQF